MSIVGSDDAIDAYKEHINDIYFVIITNIITSLSLS